MKKRRRLREREQKIQCLEQMISETLLTLVSHKVTENVHCHDETVEKRRNSCRETRQRYPPCRQGESERAYNSGDFR